MKLKIAMIAALALAGSVYFAQSSLADACAQPKKPGCEAKKDCGPAEKKEKKKDCADKKDCDVKEKKAGECKVDTAK